MRVQEDEVLRLRTEMSVFLRQKGSVGALVALDLSAELGDNYEGIATNKPLFKSTYFLNTIVFYGLLQESAVLSYYLPLKEEIEEIIALIEEEIELRS